MTAVDAAKAVIFDGPATCGAWGKVLRAFAPYSANGTPLEPCGTPAARQRHYRRGEDPCPPCKAAPGHPGEKRRTEWTRKREDGPHECPLSVRRVTEAGRG